MTRPSWLLGTLLMGTVAGCSNDATTGTTAGGGSDASPPFDATVPSDAGADATPVTLGAPDASDDTNAGSDDATAANATDAGSSLVNPSTLAFGLVSCTGSAAPQSFTVVNPTTSSATWTATLGMGTASAFRLAPAGGTLGPKQSAQVTVTPNAVPSISSTSANALGDLATVSVGSSSATVALTETAQGAVLAFEPTSVAFGPVPLSLGPQSQYFAVQNSGNLPANVTVTLTGDPSFTLPGQSSTQALTAPSGALADSQITYAPTATTTVTGSIALGVGSTPLCGPLPTALPVSGTGTNGQVGVTPPTIVFGNAGLIPCGTAAAPATVTLSNTGSAAYNFTAALTHGGSYYTVSPASGTVTTGAPTIVTVTPKPIPTSSATTSGEYDDTLTITTNVVGDSPHSVSLQETAQGAIIARSTGNLGFGNVGLGATISNSTAIVFSNTGNVDATLTFTNGDPAFVQSTPLIVGAGTFVAENVSFSPTQLAPYADIGTVALATSGDGGTIPLCANLPGNLTLSGTGTLAGLAASPGSLNFGYIPCGQAGTALEVTITNNGPATTYTASLLKGIGSYFQISPTSGSLTSGGTVEFTVTPQPLPMPGSTSGNFYGDTLQVVSASGNIVDVALNQTALGAVLTFSKGSLALGTVTSGTSTTTALTVGNSGTAPASVTLTPFPMPTFGVTSSAATTIPGSGAWPYTVSFSPPSPGPYTGSIALSVSSSTLLCAALPANVTLSGTGN